MTKLTIDGHEVEVADGLSILQACQSIGIEVPHFCFHERLSIAGNCRMCLVEVEKAPKLLPACVTAVTDGQVVHVYSESAKKARESVLEFSKTSAPLSKRIWAR